MCAFRLNGFRLLFHTNRLPKNNTVIFLPCYRGAICVVLTVYHDLHLCDYGGPMLKKK